MNEDYYFEDEDKAHQSPHHSPSSSEDWSEDENESSESYGEMSNRSGKFSFLNGKLRNEFKNDPKIKVEKLDSKEEDKNENLQKISPEDNYGRWSKREHNRFLKGLILYGRNWKKLNSFIKTRTNIQVRTHAQKFKTQLQKSCSPKNKIYLEILQSKKVPKRKRPESDKFISPQYTGYYWPSPFPNHQFYFPSNPSFSGISQNLETNEINRLKTEFHQIYQPYSSSGIMPNYRPFISQASCIYPPYSQQQINFPSTDLTKVILSYLLEELQSSSEAALTEQVTLVNIEKISKYKNKSDSILNSFNKICPFAMDNKDSLQISAIQDNLNQLDEKIAEYYRTNSQNV